MLLLLFVAIALTTIYFPLIVILILCANLLIALLLSFLHILAAFTPIQKPYRNHQSEQPLVTLIVPAYNEPPNILMQTLDALSRLKYHNYKVIVIDNNTTDAMIWTPVLRLTQSLGKKFTFLHVENLPGFKAGAINYALNHVDHRSKYVAIVDADYVIKPGYVTEALEYFTDENISLVQFPQYYRNNTASNQAIIDEYQHFFKIFMKMANYFDCVPSTGTISMYKISALLKIKGFNGQMLTEDAEISVRLYASGGKGVYVDKYVGAGLIPYDIEAYRKQKLRWAIGNAQSIRTLFKFKKSLNWRTKIGFLSHLTAWLHPNFFPLSALVGYVVTLLPFIQLSTWHQLLANLSFISIFSFLIAKGIIFIIAMRGKNLAYQRAMAAFLIHISLTLLYSTALSYFFVKPKASFNRTNKFILDTGPSLLKNTYLELIIGLWFLFGAFILSWGTSQAIGLALTALIPLSIYFTYFKISNTKVHSSKIINQQSHKFQSYLKAS